MAPVVEQNRELFGDRLGLLTGLSCQEIVGLGGVGFEVVEFTGRARRVNERLHSLTRGGALLDIERQIQQRSLGVVLDVTVLLGPDRSDGIVRIVVRLLAVDVVADGIILPPRKQIGCMGQTLDVVTGG